MTRSRKKPSVGAADLMAELSADQDYQRRINEEDLERDKNQALLRGAEVPILDDLHNVDCDVESVWDLVNTSEPYPNALPILLRHLELGAYPERVMEGLGRALAVKPAVTFWGRLRACWLGARSEGEEDGAAVALAACATAQQVDDLIEFLSVTNRGQSRIYFIRPILEFGGEAGRAVVESLRADPVFGKEASALLQAKK